MTRNFIYNKKYYENNYNIDEITKLASIKERKIVIQTFSIFTQTKINNNKIVINENIKNLFIRLIHYEHCKICNVTNDFIFTIKNIQNFIIDKNIIDKNIIDNQYYLIPLLILKNVYIVGIFILNNNCKHNILSRYNVLSRYNLLCNIDKNEVNILKGICNNRTIDTIKNIKLNINGIVVILDLIKIFKISYKYFIKCDIVYIVYKDFSNSFKSNSLPKSLPESLPLS